jgi:hypothetical protein
MKSLRIAVVAASVLLSAGAGTLRADVGESAVISLIFPPGARATGLGETFVAISDDINATFFNPAGLGQPPLANSWDHYQHNSSYIFTSIAALPKKTFELSQNIWVGTNKGLLFYNGKAWNATESYLLTDGDKLEDVAQNFIDLADEIALSKAVRTIMRENGIEMDRFKALRTLLKRHLIDSLNTPEHLDDFAFKLLELNSSDRTSAKAYALIDGAVDSAAASAIADSLALVYQQLDKELADIVELKIPFSIAIDESVTVLAVDKAEQLWVGTQNGLWNFDGSRWKRTTMLDGLPSNAITTIAIGDEGLVSVGTLKGVATLTDGVWKNTSPTNERITALAIASDNKLWVGTNNGLYLQKQNSWARFDTANGIVSSNITALMVDAKDRLWVGGENGVAIYDALTWKRYKFPNSTVNTIMEYGKDQIWLGTNRGAITYQELRSRSSEAIAAAAAAGKQAVQVEWKSYHSKNALRGDDVRGMITHGRDVWLVTESAINQYNSAEVQAMAFYEPLLPAFNLPELWHLYWALVVPTDDWGTLGLTLNFINMGKNPLTDALGRVLDEVHSWEGVVGLSYGFGITPNLSLGLNAKYVKSNLAPGSGPKDEGIGRTFALDAGLLKHNFLLDNLSLGVTLQNMGPPIYYVRQDQSDPIPFTVRVGADYSLLNTPLHNLHVAMDINRELVKNRPSGTPDPFWKTFYSDIFEIDGYDALSDEKQKSALRANVKDQFQEIIYNVGVEYWYVNFLAFRSGLLFDYIGERYEWTFGIGLKYGSFNVDWSYIYSPENFMQGALKRLNETKTGGTGARDGQWRISLIGRI